MQINMKTDCTVQTYVLLLLLLLVTAARSCTSETWWPTERSLKTQQQLIFIKTHKTGGSTVTSVLHRYCDTHTIKCSVQNELPVYHFSQIYDKKEHWLSTAHFQQLDIFASHVRYWPGYLQRFFRQPVPYITIVRDPVEKFVSGWLYAKKRWREEYNIVSVVDSLPEDYRDLPTDFINELQHNSLEAELCPTSPTWALTDSYNSSSTSCESTIDDIQQGKIALVMITERMDESLVLLARMLGWNTEDIVYSSMKDNSKNIVTVVPDRVKQKIRGWLNTDVRLYEAARRLFQQRISSQSRDFTSDLLHFRTRNTEAALTCYLLHKNTTAAENRKFPNACDCARMSLDNSEWNLLKNIEKGRPSKLHHTLCTQCIYEVRKHCKS